MEAGSGGADEEKGVGRSERWPAQLFKNNTGDIPGLWWFGKSCWRVGRGGSEQAASTHNKYINTGIVLGLRQFVRSCWRALKTAQGERDVAVTKNMFRVRKTTDSRVLFSCC